MANNEEAYRKTIEHISLIQRFLLSAQIELSRRIVTHDRSKLESPEWEMFAEITHKLEGLTYGSPEYESQRQEMLGQALGHHYAHNRHHPEFFENGKLDNQIESHLIMIRWAMKNACIMPDDIFGWENLERYLQAKQKECISSVNNMNLFDILEMVIDWYCATKRHADGDINKSILINKDRFGLSDQLVKILQNTVPWLRDEFGELSTQKDIHPPQA